MSIRCSNTCGIEVLFRGTSKFNKWRFHKKEYIKCCIQEHVKKNITTAKIYVIGGFQCSCFLFIRSKLFLSEDFFSTFFRETRFSNAWSFPQNVNFRSPRWSLKRKSWLTCSFASDLEICNKRRISVNFSSSAIAELLRFHPGPELVLLFMYRFHRFCIVVLIELMVM